MNQVITEMLKNYPLNSIGDYENALKEIIQELTLLGLFRAKFFEHAAFYGGTALRILYGLDRFSEDLDFSLLKPNPDFELESYISSLKEELASFGFQCDIEKKDKKKKGRVESAFLKTNTLNLLLDVKTPKNLVKNVHYDKILKIKFEVDTNPPGGFETEAHYLLRPIPFSVNTYCLSDLFAGKMHALLCRSWKNRVKGRDWYDLVWYVSRKTPLKLSHLKERMVQSGDFDPGDELTQDVFISQLTSKIARVDLELAKKDVAPFLVDSKAIEVWSKDFFTTIGKRIEFDIT